MPGPVRMRLDAIACVWMHSDTFEDFGKFNQKIRFCNFYRFLRNYAETDVTSMSLANFRFRYTYLELDMTLGAHLGIVCRPGMAFASPFGRLLSTEYTVDFGT